jgi:CheY-like chemotaxis protein
MREPDAAATPSPKVRLPDFHDLMLYRIMDILLVASPYDSFILEEAGQLAERVLGEFRNLDLHYGPGLTSVTSGEEALALLREGRSFNLIIAALRLPDMTGAQLARRVHEAGLDVPLVLLAFDNRELQEFLAGQDVADVDRAFLWQGDARVLLAIVKYVEDKKNVAHDTRAAGVQVIILIEDNVRYYSSFLAVIYGELLQHSQRLVSEAINVSDKILRMRARPKILLCGSFEEAWDAFSDHQEDILGVVSDVEFPREGAWSPEAGLEFARRVKERWPDVPVLLQSSRPENEALARGIGADFLLKGSPLLLGELRRFMLGNFGFGDFVFRLPEGTEVGRATDLKSLEKALENVPAKSIVYHAERNHFSKWLKARTEFALALELRPRKVTDYPSVEDLRQSLIDAIRHYRLDRRRRAVADFDRDRFDSSSDLARIGGGSLGGKARGLAFLRRLLGEARLDRDFPGVSVFVPPAVVLGTDVFDEFLDRNDLDDFAIRSVDDGELQRRFRDASFPEEALLDLLAFLSRTDYPLAVRSSSLLEDSQYQPFTGVYETVMLPNNHPFSEVRLEQLLNAVKRVYASTFSLRTKNHVRATPYRLEEEKMAVILQRIVGTAHAGRFYPDFAGIARSHNFYPIAPLSAADGVAAVALGLGRTVADGGNCLRFCPRYPRHLVQFSSVADILNNSQKGFWALDLERGSSAEPNDEMETLFELAVAEADGTLGALGSTYSPENDAVYEGVSRPGVRLVTFSSMLRHGTFPMAEILDRLLEMGAWGMGAPVEIEFAVNLSASGAKEFGVLQLRPLALSHETEELELGHVEPARILCQSPNVMGNGRITDLRDVVVVDYHRFDRSRSGTAAQEVAEINASLVTKGVPYLLVGVGRWGSSEPWLGIPVAWEQISGARVVVEAGFKDFRVSPSQGTHFFQNLSSFNVGYFTVNPDVGDGFVDWDYLAALPSLRETPSVRHLRLDRPLVIMMNGRKSEGIILKPE